METGLDQKLMEGQARPVDRVFWIKGAYQIPSSIPRRFEEFITAVSPSEALVQTPSGRVGKWLVVVTARVPGFSVSYLKEPVYSHQIGDVLRAASIHLDLACEAQLAQMAPRYNLPLPSFTAKGFRWHIADFRITYAKPIRNFNPLRIEADVIELAEDAMIVEFGFFDEEKSQTFAFGTIRFDLVGANDVPVSLPPEVRDALMRNGRVK